MRPVGILSLKGVEDVKNCNSSAKTRAAFLRAHGNDHPRRQPLSGAHAAKTNLFADLMVATSDDSVKKQWQDGLRLIREEAARSSLAGALRKAAVNEGNPQTDLEQFVALPKQMTVDGYYTSATAIHQDMEYLDNTYLPAFPECTHREHQG